jgi:hypothetical protein
VVPTPLDPTRALTPAPPVPGPPPEGIETIFVPPPTVPSTAAPPVLLPPRGRAPRASFFEFRPGIGLLEEYSDNFTLTEINRVENFRSGVTPTLDIGINGAFTKGWISYVLAVVHDSSKESQDIELFHRVDAQLSWDATPRLKFTLIDTFIKSDEPTVADRLNLSRERRLFTTHAFTARSEYRIDRVATTASYHLATFSADDEETTSHTISATASAVLAVANTVTLGYEYLASDSSSTPAADPFALRGIGAGATTITGHRVSTAVERRLNALTTGGLSGSYAIRDVDTNGQSNDYDIWTVSAFGRYAAGRVWISAGLGYSGLRQSTGSDSAITSFATASYTLPRGSVSVGFESGFAETFAEGQNRGVIRTSGVNGTVVHQFTPLITGTVTAYYRRNDTAGAGDTVVDRAQTAWGANVTLSIQFTSWLRLTLDYLHSDSSSAPLPSTIENRGRITLQARF